MTQQTSNEAFEEWWLKCSENNSIYNGKKCYAEQAWQAATARVVDIVEKEMLGEIAELKNMYVQSQAENAEMREALEKLAGTNGYVKSVALQALKGKTDV